MPIYKEREIKYPTPLELVGTGLHQSYSAMMEAAARWAYDIQVGAVKDDGDAEWLSPMSGPMAGFLLELRESGIGTPSLVARISKAYGNIVEVWSGYGDDDKA
jgi:hypothetical protein